MKISFSAGIVMDEKLYFSDEALNGMFCVDLEKKKTTYLGLFPNEDPFKQLLHGNACSWKDYAIFVPNQGKHVHIYSIKTKELKSIEIYKESDERYVFNYGIIWDSRLYLFPMTIKQPIVILDLYTLEQELIDLGQNKIFKSAVGDSDRIFSKPSVLDDDVFFAIENTSTIIRYNLLRGSINIIKTDIDSLMGVYTIDKNNIWLTTFNTGIYLFSVSEKKSSKCNIGVNNYEPLNLGMIIKLSDRYIMVPDLGGEIMSSSVNDKTNFFKFRNASLNKNKRRVMGYKYNGFCDYNGGLFIYPPFGEELVYVGDKEVENIKTNWDDLERFYTEHPLEQIQTIREGKYNLDDYIKMV